jgi:hypothetical protein
VTLVMLTLVLLVAELCWNLGDEAIRRRGLPARQ